MAVTLSVLDSGTFTVIGLVDPEKDSLCDAVDADVNHRLVHHVEPHVNHGRRGESAEVRAPSAPCTSSGLVRPVTSKVTLTGCSILPRRRQRTDIPGWAIVNRFGYFMGRDYTVRKYTAAASKITGAPVLETVIVGATGGCWPSS